MTFIYALVDPRTPQKWRYIGFTNNPRLRLQRHIKYSKRNTAQTHKECWIRKLLSENQIPDLIILECFEAFRGEETTRREQYWIQRARDEGFDLTNSTDGGEGWINPSDETRSRISSKLKGRPKSPEHRVAAALARKGYTPSAETRLKISKTLTGRKATLETRTKQSLSHKGRIRSEEARAKSSTALKGRPLPAEHCAKLKEARNRYLLKKAEEELALLREQIK